MIRIVLARAVAALLLLPSITAGATASSEVVDLIANPDAANTLELPTLVDGATVYPLESQRLNERGKVRLSFVVGTDGTVSDVRIVQPAPYFRLNDAAIASMLSRSYIPAMRDGSPVAVRIWAIDSFNPDPAAKDNDTPLDAAADQRYACRYGTHHVAVDACSALMAAGKIQPQDGLYPRANAYAALGQYAEAIADYDKLIGFKPALAELYRRRGFSYEALGQYARAIEDYDHAVTLDPKDTVFYFDRGFANDGLGRHDVALADFKAALDHRPMCKSLTVERGVGTTWAERPYNPGVLDKGGPGLRDTASTPTYEHNNQTAVPTAMKTTTVNSEPCKPSWVPALSTIADIAPGSPDEEKQLEYRCWARAVWGKELEGALADCNRALQLKPAYARAFGTRGLVYIRKGDYAAAVKDFDSALAGNPRMASALYVRGLAKARTGNASGAQADILAARRVDPEIAATFATYEMTPLPNPVR